MQRLDHGGGQSRGEESEQWEGVTERLQGGRCKVGTRLMMQVHGFEQPRACVAMESEGVDEPCAWKTEGFEQPRAWLRSKKRRAGRPVVSPKSVHHLESTAHLLTPSSVRDHVARRRRYIDHNTTRVRRDRNVWTIQRGEEGDQCQGRASQGKAGQGKLRRGK